MTSGVFVLIGEAALDLLWLPWRVAASLVLARRWRATTRRLILAQASPPETIHAAQDAHPPR